MAISQKDILKLPDGLHRVAECLYLRVRGNSRSFIFKYQSNGKRREKAIGTANRIKLARAKEIALKYRTALAEGIGPEEPKQGDKKERTFNEIYAEAIEVTDNVRQWKNAKHRAQWFSTIETYACPVIGDMPLNSITRNDIIKVLEPIWMEKNPTAIKLRGKIERVFAYAIFKGEYSHPNPATYRGNLDMVFAPQSKVHTEKHFESMTVAEARDVCAQFWRRGTISYMAILFGILTVLRANEFIHARWDEIDFENAIWSVPPERRKVKRDYPHRVPLSTQALAVLKRCQLANPEMKGYIFKNPRIEEKSINLETPRLLLMRYFKRPMTMHGTRSTFRDWAEETGQNTKAAERALMHVEPNKVTRAYQRSDLLELRRPLMQAWADEVLPMSVIEGERVRAERDLSG